MAERAFAGAPENEPTPDTTTANIITAASATEGPENRRNTPGGSFEQRASAEESGHDRLSREYRFFNYFVNLEDMSPEEVQRRTREAQKLKDAKAKTLGPVGIVGTLTGLAVWGLLAGTWKGLVGSLRTVGKLVDGKDMNDVLEQIAYWYEHPPGLKRAGAKK